MQIALKHAEASTKHAKAQLAACEHERDSLKAAVATLESALSDAQQAAANERSKESSAASAARRLEQELAVLKQRVASLDEEVAAARLECQRTAENAQAVHEREALAREELQKAGKAMVMAQVSDTYACIHFCTQSSSLAVHVAIVCLPW
jgi:chromosome segregation ATPase